MKFTLTYDGELRANDSWQRKWEIRKHFHPQLQELWRVSPALRSVQKNRYLPKGGFWNVEVHHSQLDERQPPQDTSQAIDLLAPLAIANRKFLPLVRDSLALQCALKIIFLRKEEPGRVYQAGDLDNRLKTLFDALSVPQDTQTDRNDVSVADPIYCVLEDDRLIQRIDVDTQRLLSRPNSTKHEVQLLIEVDIRVTDSRLYNQAFLGD